MRILNILYKICLKIIFRLNPGMRIRFLKTQGCRIGTNCTIFSSVSFGSEPYLISIGNDVKITDGVRFVTHDGGMHVLRNLKLLPDADSFGQIKISNNVFIGINSIIMPGVEIGENSVIGAGSVVTKDIPANSIAAGVPAKVIRNINEYYNNYKDSVDHIKNSDPKEKKKYLINKYNIR